MSDKTHFRKAFDSPYLSSADIVEPTVLTVQRVTLEADRTKKTKDLFNTAWFAEKEIREGEKLKPMILNATNSKTMRNLANSAFIEDWQNMRVTIYVDHNVRFGKETMEGLRISPVAPEKRALTPDSKAMWDRAIELYIKDGNLRAVLAKVDMSPEHQKQLMNEADAKKSAAEQQKAPENAVA